MSVVNEELERIASAIERNAQSMTGLSKASNRRFGIAYGGLAVAIVGILFIAHFARVRADENNKHIDLLAEQSLCYLSVEGAYMQHLGEVADLNGSAVRGDPVDRPRAIKAAQELRRDALLMGSLGEICYTGEPDRTPLDGILPNGKRIIPEGMG